MRALGREVHRLRNTCSKRLFAVVCLKLSNSSSTEQPRKVGDAAQLAESQAFLWPAVSTSAVTGQKSSIFTECHWPNEHYSVLCGGGSAAPKMAPTELQAELADPSEGLRSKLQGKPPPKSGAPSGPRSSVWPQKWVILVPNCARTPAYL